MGTIGGLCKEGDSSKFPSLEHNQNRMWRVPRRLRFPHINKWVISPRDSALLNVCLWNPAPWRADAENRPSRFRNRYANKRANNSPSFLGKGLMLWFSYALPFRCYPLSALAPLWLIVYYSPLVKQPPSDRKDGNKMKINDRGQSRHIFA